MGVLPLQFELAENAKTLALDGSETYSVRGLEQISDKGSKARLIVSRKSGEKVEANLRVRLDSLVEREYYESGGILDYVLQRTVKTRSK